MSQILQMASPGLCHVFKILTSERIVIISIFSILCNSLCFFFFPAGFIVDLTGSYTGVIWFSVANLLSGAVLMFLCYLISQKMKRKRQLPGEEV